MQVSMMDCTPNPEEHIGRMAAICYDGDTSPAACIRRAKQCKDKGHLSTLRFANATFNIKGISRVCSHQMVRHAHLSYLQRSQRYCAEEEFTFIIPPGLPNLDAYLKAASAAHDAYLAMIDAGVKKEDARYLLPQAVETEMNITGNFQAWLDFINLRDDPAAQLEIRMIAKEVRRLLAEVAPNIFGG